MTPSISTVITGGFGTFGSAGLVITSGFGTTAVTTRNSGGYEFLNPRPRKRKEPQIVLSPDAIEVVSKSLARDVIRRVASKERQESAYLARVKAELDALQIEMTTRELRRVRKEMRRRQAEEETLTALLMTYF